MTRFTAICVLGLGLNAVESRMRVHRHGEPHELDAKITVDFVGFVARSKVDPACNFTTIADMNEVKKATETIDAEFEKAIAEAQASVTEIKDSLKGMIESGAGTEAELETLAGITDVVPTFPHPDFDLIFPGYPTFSWVDMTPKEEGGKLIRHHMAITLGAQSSGSVTAQASFIFWSQPTKTVPLGAYTYVKKQTKSRRNVAGSGDLGLKLNRGSRKITDAANKEMWITTSRGTYEVFILSSINDGYLYDMVEDDVTFHVASGENFDESWLTGVDDGEHNWILVSTNKPNVPAMVNSKGEIAFVDSFHFTSAGLKQDFVPEKALDFKKDPIVDSFWPCVY